MQLSDINKPNKSCEVEIPLKFTFLFNIEKFGIIKNEKVRSNRIEGKGLD